MLKGKKGIYILVPLNVLIWGYFVYRFYSLYNNDDANFVKENPTVVKLATLEDTNVYELKLTYNDPFLKKEPKSKLPKARSEMQETPKQLKIEHKKQKEEPKPIPDIKYLGLVKNNANGLATAIISINGLSKLIKQDETIDGLCFKNFTSDNLTVLWNKEKIVISK